MIVLESNHMSKPILFCDYDGVLCHDRYWQSLPREQFDTVQRMLFKDDTSIVRDWMRGKYSSEDVNAIVAERLGIPYQELWNVFVEDCKKMHVSKRTLETLNSLRSRYTVILITGNMDSFSRFTLPELKLDQYFDHISNSFEEKLNKTDNDGELFLRFADRYGADIRDCVMMDDSQNVYDIFEKIGGKPALVTKERDIDFHLSSIVNDSQ